MTLSIRPATKEEIESVIKVDPDTHKYYLDCVCVSDLKETIWHFPVEDIPPDRLRKSIERGTHVHKMLEMYVSSNYKIDPRECEDKVKTHIDQYEWMKNKVDEIFSAEDNSPLFEAYTEKSFVAVAKTDKGKLIFTGTADLLVKNFKEAKKTLIDYKTTSKSKPEQEAFQLTAYFLGMFGYIPNKDETLMIINGNIKKQYIFSQDEIDKSVKIVEEAVNRILEKQITW